MGTKKMTNNIKKNSSIFLDFVKNAITASPKVQRNFLNITESFAETIYKILKEEDLIMKLSYDGKDFWKRNNNKISCFIDGGISKSSLISAAPIGIRAGSYIVQPNAKFEDKREVFEESFTFVGDLYDHTNNNLYDLDKIEDDYEIEQINNKKKDAGRIIFETATLIKHLTLNKQFDFTFLHGPLQATCHPFTSIDFPNFSSFAVNNLFPNYQNKKLGSASRHFVNVYLDALLKIKKSNLNIFGVVETASSSPYIKNLLYNQVQKGLLSQKDYKAALITIKKYKISDSNLFEIILNEKQALKPLEIKKQIQGFGVNPNSPWADVLEMYPKVFIGYIKSNNNHCPIRIETLNKSENLIENYEYILAASRLLPSYGFPAALNIVDRFSKIPIYMSRASRNCYASHLLKRAIESKDQNTISFAVKILSQKARSWINRPVNGGFRK